MAIEWVKTNPRLAAAAAALLALAWVQLRRAAVAGEPARSQGCAGGRRLGLEGCRRGQVGSCWCPPLSPPLHPAPASPTACAVFGDFGPVLLLSGAIAVAGSVIPDRKSVV